ncbi:putative F-box domain, FBD domain, leucine-rich repeat domain superfamily [Helianthus annuus]|nr:putative F-box domain, FBD domain, leucine-rich repeat domain superfamily [Helianthus annuus]
MMALEASEFAPEDIISSMPDSVVTNILQRLPLQDAVRTGILSRNWRFKWTMLSQLIFDTNFFAHLIERTGENTFGLIISRLLLHLNSTITKSVLVLPLLDVVDIHHLILFLSEKGIKDLTLTNWCKPQVKMPTHLFSCLELKHLNISGCCFNPPPSFRGFPNLLSLELCNVQFGGDLGEFLAQCPLLESLDLGYLSYTGNNVKLVEIAKLENLKILSLSLCHLETTTTTSSCDIFELLRYLPKLQELGLDFHDYKLTEGGARKTFPTAFPSLKAIKLTRIRFSNGVMLSFALETIRHFSNLQTLEITGIMHLVDDPVPVLIPIPEVEYNTMELRSVVFNEFKGSENEVYLLKYFLACSPSLKKIVIHPDWSLALGEQFMLAKKLLKLHRASPIAEIHFD